MRDNKKTEPTFGNGFNATVNQVATGPSINVSELPEIRDQDIKANGRKNEQTSLPSTPEIRLRSRTSPQIISGMESILLSDRFFEWRKNKISEIESQYKDELERKKLIDMLFAYERAQLDKFEWIQSVKPQDLPAHEKYLKEFKDPQSFVAASYGHDSFKNFIQIHVSDVWEQFSHDLAVYGKLISKNESDPQKKELMNNPVLSRMLSVESLFKEKFSEVEPEFEKQFKNDPKSSTLSAALKVLKYGSMWCNPAGAMVSLIMKKIYQSDAMKPYREKVKDSISTAVKNYWTPEKAQKYSWLNNDVTKRIAAGVGVASLVALTAIGITHPDEAVELARSALEYGSSGLDNVVQNASHTADVVVDAAKFTGNRFEELFADSGIAHAGEIPGLSDSIYGTDLAAEQGAVLSTPEPQTADMSQAAKVSQTASDIDHRAVGVPQTVPPVELSVTPKPGVPYTVKSGDCLSVIAEQALKAQGIPYNYTTISAYYHEIALANGIDDPNVIKAGQVINLDLPPGVHIGAPSVLQSAVATPSDILNSLNPAALQPDLTPLSVGNALPSIPAEPQLRTLQGHIDAQLESTVSPRDLETIGRVQPIYTYDDNGNMIGQPRSLRR